jgi:hypothetical protein
MIPQHSMWLLCGKSSREFCVESSYTGDSKRTHQLNAVQKSKNHCGANNTHFSPITYHTDR